MTQGYALGLRNTGPQGWQGVVGNPGVTGGALFYFHESDASDISGYKKLMTAGPDTGEVTIVKQLTTPGDEFLLRVFVTEPGVPGVAEMPAGVAQSNVWGKVDDTDGSTFIRGKVYSRDTGGNETLLMTVDSTDVDSTLAMLYPVDVYINQSVPLDPTYRIVIKLYGVTTSDHVITLTTYYEGSTHTSYVRSTFSVSGTQGPQGNQGPQGVQGPQGWQGYQGWQGEGVQGVQGWQGPLPEISPLVIVQARRSTTDNFTAAWANVTFDITDIETDASVIEHDDVYTERVDIKQTGYYFLQVSGTMHANAAGTYSVQFVKNDLTTIPGSLYTTARTAGADANIFTSVFVHLSADDYVTVQILRSADPADGYLNTNVTFGVQLLEGPSGAQGRVGSQGNQGNQGWQGTNPGPTGPQGWQGFQGYQGAQGPQGWQGWQGPLPEVAPVAVIQAIRTTAYTLTDSWADITLDYTGVETAPTIIDHNPSVNPERISFHQDGCYLLQAAVIMSCSAAGTFSLRIRKNGDTTIAETGVALAAGTDENLAGNLFLELEDGDYITVQAQHSGGSAAGSIKAGAVLGAELLQGPSGAQGGLGPQGNQGNQGWQGTNPGPTGPQGAQGWQGLVGAQGSQGNAGVQGSTGSQGNQGWQGWQGWQGTGVQGPQGWQGYQGWQGNQGRQGWQGGVGYGGATATGNITTSSATDVLATSMTVTPVSGTYLVWFSGSFNVDNNAYTVYADIWSAGAQVPESEVRANFYRTPYDVPFCCQATVTVNGSQAIEGRWRVSNAAATGTMHQRVLNILKVA